MRDTANWTAARSNRYLASCRRGSRSTAHLCRRRHTDPYVGFETRIVPENITLLPKTGGQVTGGNGWNERSSRSKKGDTVATILRETRRHARRDQGDRRRAWAARPRRRTEGRPEAAHAGRRGRPRPALQPIRVIVTATARSKPSSRFPTSAIRLRRRRQHEHAVADAGDDDEEDDGKGMRLYQSIYETALRNNIPKPVIEELIRIYSYDVDFQHKAQPGDSFDVLYAHEDETPADDAKAEVMFAALTTGGEVKKYYHFKTTDDGIVDYYDETGKSAKKFLVRKPVATGIMRSGLRRPQSSAARLLSRCTPASTGPHRSAPRSTPPATARSRRSAGKCGYGKYVRIRHSNGYETAYGHMTAFSRSTQPGARVRQGQVIGYVGSTGLSTGPHVHYEILVNGRFVDPLRVKLPRGRVLEGPLMANFDKERDRVDSIITRSSPRVAQTGQPAR